VNFDSALFNELFSRFPEPMVFVSVNTVQYYNPAALSSFPSLATSNSIPMELMTVAVLPGDGICTCTVGGHSFSAMAYPMENGRLVVLRPAHKHQKASLPLQLRVQITNLFGAAQLLGEKAVEFGTEEKLPELAILNQGLYRLLRLTQSLELMEELSQDQPLRFRSAPMDLAGLCHRLTNGVSSLVSQSGGKFCYESSIASVLTWGDSELLQIMLLHLISNALKAAGTEGEAGMRLTRIENRCVINIWDRGPGLDVTTMTELFESSDSQDGVLGKGLGLGLQIVRRIAVLHGGTILMEGRKGIGVRVTISLPIVPIQDVPLETPKLQMDVSGGFPLLLVQLSDALSYESFSPLDVY